MKRSSRVRGNLAVCAFAALALAFGGCTKYASPDDLRKLDEAKKAADMAEKDLAGAKAERASLEAEVARKQAELAAAKAEFENVKNR